MFCPVCKDEFRAGFTHCANCDVALVDDLSQVPAARPEAPPPLAPRMAEYCGFFDLDEARQSRETLRADGVRSDILIRQASADDDGELREEYWLRVDAAQFRRAATLLDQAESAPDDEQTRCDACGAAVSAEESFCPQCGQRFEGR